MKQFIPLDKFFTSNVHPESIRIYNLLKDVISDLQDKCLLTIRDFYYTVNIPDGKYASAAYIYKWQENNKHPRFSAVNTWHVRIHELVHDHQLLTRISRKGNKGNILGLGTGIKLTKKGERYVQSLVSSTHQLSSPAI